MECAVEAKANLIVTGDKHLLSLKVYEGIGIVRLTDFLNTVDTEERRKRAIEIAGRFSSGKRDISREHNKYLTEAFSK